MFKTMNRRKRDRAINSAAIQQKWHRSMVKNFLFHAENQSDRAFWENLANEHSAEIRMLTKKIKDLLVRKEVGF